MHRSRISRMALAFWMVSASFLCSLGAADQTPSQMVGKAAPSLVRSDLNGRNVDLAKYRGKIVLLNFWATWCSSCQVELPQFEAMQKKYGEDRLQVITVSMDDSETPVQKTARRLHLKLPVVMGDAKLGEAYGGVLGLPVTFLIDRNGTIVAKFKSETAPDKIEAEIKRMLSQSS